MKIKRTLPSIDDYPFDLSVNLSHKGSNSKDQRKSEVDNYISVSQLKNLQRMKRIQSSSSKYISEGNIANASKVDKTNNQIATQSVKRIVTFANVGDKKNKSRDHKSNKSKSRQRIPIFGHSPAKKKQQDPVISRTISIKQLSERLKNIPSNTSEKIVKKISELQHVIIGLQSQLKETRKRESSASPQKPSPNLDSSIYKLQMQQMRRCEKIARQNQQLYQNLVKNLQKQNSKSVTINIKNGKGGSGKGKQGQDDNNTITFSARHGPKITAFEDFQQYQIKNGEKEGDENEAPIQIVSPFYLEDNKGQIKLKKSRHHVS